MTYSGRTERLLANLVDTIILFLPASLVAALTAGTDANGNPTVAPVSLLVVFCVNLIYYTAFTSGPWQATPGKRLLGLYVIRADRRSLTQRDALERFLAYSLPSLPMYASFMPSDFAPMVTLWLSVFWFAPILTHPMRLGVHDKLCNTRVVVGKVGA